MDKKNDDRLTQFVESHGIDIDTLSISERDEAELKLEKAAKMERRGIEDRADTLRQELANMLGVQDEDTDTDTLSETERTTVILKESDSGEGVDTLSRTMTPRQVNQAVNRVVDGAIHGGSE